MVYVERVTNSSLLGAHMRWKLVMKSLNNNCSINNMLTTVALLIACCSIIISVMGAHMRWKSMLLR